MKTILRWLENLSPFAYIVLLAALAAIGMTIGSFISFFIASGN